MILHYLKISLRNLLKYKTHSFISALCLAVGIVCYTFVCFFIQEFNKSANMPHAEQRIRIETNAERNRLLLPAESMRLEEHPIDGLECLSINSYDASTEIEIIDNEQRRWPYKVRYIGINENYFTFNERKLLHGSRLPQAPDEVVLSEKFARKAYGYENPVGSIIYLSFAKSFSDNGIQAFKVVNVVQDNNMQEKRIDCYFYYGGMNNAILNIEGYLSANTHIESLNKTLQSITWQKGKETVYPHAYFTYRHDKNMETAKYMILFIASLILISGLINFLKFIIQMFFNRQREVALRKCMGSDIKGLFMLLFTEVFWMMSVAFLLSLALTEVMITLAEIYIPDDVMPDLSLTAIYAVQFRIYLALLAVCTLVIGFPIRRLRRVSIISQISNRQGRHIFRSFMMWFQLSISIFFVGTTLGINMAWNEAFGRAYSPLSDRQEEEIITVKMNSNRMWQHVNPILDGIRALPGCIESLAMMDDLQKEHQSWRTYRKADRSEASVNVVEGHPDYFSFLNIPMEGKAADEDAEDIIYVSEDFKQQLDKDSIQGMVELNGQTFRIAGTFKALYKERKEEKAIGSAFIPYKYFKHFYFKFAPGTDSDKAIRSITDICRQYVPVTLPLDIRSLADNKQTVMGSMYLMQIAMLILAVVSVLLVILSIYSAISIDTMSRQKEIAIRKINGATPWTIAGIFGRTYLVIFLAAFFVAYPVVRLMLLSIGDATVKCLQGWGWGILLFACVGLLILLTTGYKIYRIMHINPADIIKNE